jgi:purine-binding chemotaxis protein CheW
MSRLLLIVQLAGERIAVPAQDVESVVEIETVTPVPRAAAHVVGLAALRSRVLTVIDCDLALGLPARTRPACDALVVVADGHPYALLVDRVEDVVEASGDTLPVKSSLGKGWCRAVLGIVEAEGDLLLLADVRALIAGPAEAEAA